MTPTPFLGVAIAFDSPTLELDPLWVSIEDQINVTSWQIDRGRSTELDKTSTGTARITIADTQGLLDPTNLDSPFNGNLDPMKQVAIGLTNPVTDSATTIFRGFVSEWLHSLDVFEETAGVARGIDTVTLECADAFDLLSALELTPGVHGDTTTASDFADVWLKGTPSNLVGQAAIAHHVNQRIEDLLLMAGWPAGLQFIFSGNVEVQGAVVPRRDSLLTALQDAADTEFPGGVANIFMSKDGAVIFHGRYARFFPGRPGYGINHWYAGGKAQAEADEDVAVIRSPLVFRRSKNDILNAVIAMPQGIDDVDAPGQLVKDDDSIDTYGWRSASFENLLVYTGDDHGGGQTTALEETYKYADYYVGNYKTPRTRVTQLSFVGRSPSDTLSPALWALICGVEIGDLISLNTVHPGGGGFDEDFYVEGIHYSARPARTDMHDIQLTLDVSPRSFYDYNPFGEVDSGVS